MKIKILDCSRIIFQGKIISIQAPGICGYFQILENHDNFISILKNGILNIIKNQKLEEVHIKINSGILQVKNNFILIILDYTSFSIYEK